MHNIMCIHNIIYIYIYIYMKYYRMKLHYIIHCASMEWQSSDKSMAGSPIFLFFASHQYGSIVNGYPCWDTTNIWLVVEPTPLKNDGVRQLGLLFPTEWKNKTCSKPPTRYIVNVCWWVYNQTSLWGLTLYQIIKKLSLVSEQTWAELVPHTVDGRNPAPPWMVETL